MSPYLDNFYANKMVGQTGALIVDQGGNPVWFHPAPKNQLDQDFQTDSYGASQQPVISFWQGKIGGPPKLAPGAPMKGAYYFYNSQYHQFRKLQAQGKGWTTDFHELVLTKPNGAHPQGTAIFLAAKKEAKNLSRYGGSSNGAVEDEEIQQVDLKTNKLIFHWDVAKHIPLKDSKVIALKGITWDAYHANSINLNSAGDILLSLRNTWSIYALSPRGKFLWQVGGKCVTKKCLQPTKAARFSWQHDVRFDGKTKISMFDDACCNLGVHKGGSGHLGPARGLVLSLNFSKKRAGVVRQYHHSATKEVPTSGSFRFLSDGHAFIGWGQSYFYSEYTDGGSLLYDAAMPKSDQSYRAWKAAWTGSPTYKPSAAARKAHGKTHVYASWNGATTVATWKVFAGTSANKVTTLAGHAKRSGFETAIRVTKKGPYYKVEAFNSHGKPIPGGTSKPVKVS